jgi:hypothetical protein
MANDSKSITSFSDWLDEGKGKYKGKPVEAIQAYLDGLRKQRSGPEVEEALAALLDPVASAIDDVLREHKLITTAFKPQPLPVPQKLASVSWGRQITIETNESSWNDDDEESGPDSSPILAALAKVPGYEDLLRDKKDQYGDDKKLESVSVLRVPRPSDRMVLHRKSEEYLKAWWRSASGEAPAEALWIGLIQIGARTGENTDKLYLGRLQLPKEPKSIAVDAKHTLSFKPDEVAVRDEEPGPTAPTRAAEVLTPHYRLLRNLIKDKVIKPSVWNAAQRPVFTPETTGKKPTKFEPISIDPDRLVKRRSWHRAGCFYGFYWLLRHGTPTWGRFDLVSTAMNWYANGCYGNFVPRDGGYFLKGDAKLAYTTYCGEVLSMGLEREELVREWCPAGSPPDTTRRALLGANWRGKRALPLEWAKALMETLKDLAPRIQK